MCEGVFGLIIFVGFMLMHLLLYRVAWYWITYLGIIGTLLIAIAVYGFLARGVTSKIGETKPWRNVYSTRVLCLATLGGLSVTMMTALSPFVMKGARSNYVLAMCNTLPIWFIADGVSLYAIGRIAGSRGNIIIGIIEIAIGIASAMPIAIFALEHAFLLFGLICGIGSMIAGFSDYRSWLNEAKEG